MFYKSPNGGRDIPTLCKIHDAFGGLEKSHHNCLGCNFAEMTYSIDFVLQRQENLDETSISTFYADYLLWLYLFVERMEMIFEIITLPESYRMRHFEVFRQIRRWANFIKHPGYFILAHHPEYFLDGDHHFDPKKYQVIIDSKFVYEHFGRDQDSKSLRRELTNKKDVAVLFPEPINLTREFCTKAQLFMSIICENKVYREILGEQSTYENYFAAKDSGAGTPLT
jgi:hypothetical protein